MLEISLNKVVKNFGFKNILNEFDLEVTTNERIALIGPNGCGKTTIFKIIAGLENVDSGLVSIRKDATIGLLNQIPPLLSNDCTVSEVLTKGLKPIMDLESKLRALELEMSNCNSEKINSIIKEYGKTQEKFEQLGGYELQAKISKICNKFKITEEMLDRSFNSLSGGEKTIVNLASLILSNPSILLLDEPTNHLDIDTLEWFEEFLSNYKGTVIISSHDRYFLDKVITKTILIDRGKSEVFDGNYSYYLKENERRVMSEFEQYKNQQKQITAMEEAIKRLREWGKIGDNERFFKRANCIEKRLEKMKLLEKPETKKELPLDFQVNERSGKDVLEIKDLNITLGDKLIFKNASLSLKYGEKVCLMGKNGSGKSTLIKAILNNINVDSGNIKLGSNVTIGYIPQEIHFEDNNMTILEVARKHFLGTETQLRVLLAKFLFYGENVFKRIEKLSGGEKVRLKLFEIMQYKANLLILDEPTNHIDIDTKEMLEEALLDYKGTIFFISHDRYFINKLAQKIIYIEDNKFNQYIGNYDYYKEQKERVK